MLQSLTDFWTNNQTLAILIGILIIVVPLLVFYVVKALK